MQPNGCTHESECRMYGYHPNIKQLATSQLLKAQMLKWQNKGNFVEFILKRHTQIRGACTDQMGMHGGRAQQREEGRRSQKKDAYGTYRGQGHIRPMSTRHMLRWIGAYMHAHDGGCILEGAYGRQGHTQMPRGGAWSSHVPLWEEHCYDSLM